MADNKLKIFSELLNTYLGETKKVINFDIVKMPQAGFGSEMLKVAITVRKEDGSEEKLHAVAKILPPTEIARKIFNIQVTFKNEVAFYETVLPTLRNFQKEHGISTVLDSFADFYAARINLDANSKEVNDDAVLVLEDLAVSGFRNIKRQEGFDLDGAKLILRDLAKFHGTAIALKLKQPEVFEKKVKATCKDFDFSSTQSDIMMMMFKLILANNEECVPLIEKVLAWPNKSPRVPTEPFGTINHCDLWVNNTMQKFENSEITRNIFVDFQVYSYRSCASDVFFFLWTSLQKDALEENLDYLFKYYHKELLYTLTELKCDTTLFGFEKFMEEVKMESEYEFGHAFMFCFLTRSDVNFAEGIPDEAHPPSQEEILSKIPLSLQESLWYMALECNKRGWLY